MERPSRWTKKADHARTFAGPAEALFYCYSHHLSDVEIICESENPQLNGRIALAEIP